MERAARHKLHPWGLHDQRGNLPPPVQFLPPPSSAGLSRTAAAWDIRQAGRQAGPAALLYPALQLSARENLARFSCGVRSSRGGEGLSPAQPLRPARLGESPTREAGSAGWPAACGTASPACRQCTSSTPTARRLCRNKLQTVLSARPAPPHPAADQRSAAVDTPRRAYKPIKLSARVARPVIRWPRHSTAPPRPATAAQTHLVSALRILRKYLFFQKWILLRSKIICGKSYIFELRMRKHA